MGRRKPGRGWSAAAVPMICDSFKGAAYAVLADLEAEEAEYGDRPPPGSPRRRVADRRRLIAEQTRELPLLDDAYLYWVTKSMTDLVVNAADTLPEWTPDAALPSQHGFLCWERPAGHIPALDMTGGPVTWDAFWWSPCIPDDAQAEAYGWPAGTPAIELRLLTRDDGVLRIVRSGVLFAPDQPRTAEAEDSDEADPLMAVVGSCWLLMGTARVVESRPLHAGHSGNGVERPGAGSSLVQIVDLRAPARSTDPDHAGSGTGPNWKSRWWVGAHWRQQACGPQRSQRKPIFIAPHIKGPDGLPLVNRPRVNVVRD